MSNTDLFGRVTAYGLGTDGVFTYDWTPRDSAYSVASDSLYFVDGSEVFIPSGGNDWDSYFISAPALNKQGTAQFDVYLPTLPDPSPSVDYLAQISLHLSWPDELDNAHGQPVNIPIGLTQAFSGYDNTDPHVVFGPLDGAFQLDHHGFTSKMTVPVDLGNWYTLKAGYDVATLLIGYKLWKRSDPEPTDWMLVYETDRDGNSDYQNYGDGFDGTPWIDFFYSGTQQAYFDNLIINGAYEVVPYRRPLNAFITSGQLQTVTEPFTRTTTHGLGDGFTFNPYDGSNIGSSSGNTESTDIIYVDGSKAVVLVDSGTPVSSYTIPGSRLFPVGSASFDFLTPASFITFPGPMRMWLYVGGEGPYRFGIEVAVLSGSLWYAYFRTPASTGGATSAFTVSASNWYTLKFAWDSTTGLADWLVKPQGSPDSSALAVGSGQAYDRTGLDYYPYNLVESRLILQHPNLASGATFLDNLTWLARAGFTADAEIVGPTSHSFTADARLRLIHTGSFTADACLSRTILANAVLKATIPRSFSVDALIAARRFTADAFFTDLGLLKHYRERDHTGTILDSSIVLTQNVGPWSAGMTLHQVLLDLWDWISRS